MNEFSFSFLGGWGELFASNGSLLPHRLAKLKLFLNMIQWETQRLAAFLEMVDQIPLWERSYKVFGKKNGLTMAEFASLMAIHKGRNKKIDSTPMF